MARGGDDGEGMMLLGKDAAVGEHDDGDDANDGVDEGLSCDADDGGDADCDGGADGNC